MRRWFENRLTMLLAPTYVAAMARAMTRAAARRT